MEYSKKVHKPLMVIGSSFTDFMNSVYPVYGCGDVCVDLIRCGKCEKSYKGELIEVLKKKYQIINMLFLKVVY